MTKTYNEIFFTVRVGALHEHYQACPTIATAIPETIEDKKKARKHKDYAKERGQGQSHSEKAVVDPEEVANLIEIVEKVVSKPTLKQRIKRLLACGCKACFTATVIMSAELLPYMV